MGQHWTGPSPSDIGVAIWRLSSPDPRGRTARGSLSFFEWEWRQRVRAGRVELKAKLSPDNLAKETSRGDCILLTTARRRPSVARDRPLFLSQRSSPCPKNNAAQRNSVCGHLAFLSACLRPARPFILGPRCVLPSPSGASDLRSPTPLPATTHLALPSADPNDPPLGAVLKRWDYIGLVGPSSLSVAAQQPLRAIGDLSADAVIAVLAQRGELGFGIDLLKAVRDAAEGGDATCAAFWDEMVAGPEMGSEDGPAVGKEERESAAWVRIREGQAVFWR